MSTESLEQLVLSLAATVHRDIEQSQPLAESAKTRLVWFVGFSGFALLNGKLFWESVAGHTFAGSEILILSTPWLCSTLLAVVTHFLIDDMTIARNLYYSNKLAAIDLHLYNLKTSGPNQKSFNSIVFDEDPDIGKMKNKADKMTKLVNWCERLTLASIVIGLIWSVIAPLLVV